jgi:hypothetical protein
MLPLVANGSGQRLLLQLCFAEPRATGHAVPEDPGTPDVNLLNINGRAVYKNRSIIARLIFWMDGRTTQSRLCRVSSHA